LISPSDSDLLFKPEIESCLNPPPVDVKLACNLEQLHVSCPHKTPDTNQNQQGVAAAADLDPKQF